MMFNMKKHAQEHILQEVAKWSMNDVSLKRLHKAHDRAEAKKAGKRVRQERGKKSGKPKTVQNPVEGQTTSRTRRIYAQFKSC